MLWSLADDVEEVVLVSPTEGGATSKEKLHLATCMFKCSQESGVPDIQVKFFTLTPLKKMVESCEQQVFHRYAVCKQDNGTAFYPKALTDAEISADTLKRGALGAAWLGKLDALPSMHTKVLWDTEFKKTPPASLRPVKPKMWLMCKTELQAGFFYELP